MDEDKRVTISELLLLLEQKYGPHCWQPGAAQLSVLIQTILSQNTSDANSKRAFDELTATFVGWEEMASVSEEQIAAAIKSGGLADIKARRIKLTLQQILHQRGALDLEFLADLPVEEAKAWLKRLPGVGPKTAGCVLLFSLGMPALPVDTHVYRVSRRLGLIKTGVSIVKAHDILEGLVPVQSLYQFHLYLIEHGRKVCKARRPLCHRCVLAQGCPSEGSFER